MVTHDYERGMITGLPRSVVDEVRRTGKLPRGAIHPSMVDVWDALAEQRRHQLPPGMTVADIQRQRDGWDEAFDPEVWERLSGEKGAVAPPVGPKVPTGPGPSSPTIEDDPPPPESATAWMCDCHDVEDEVKVGEGCGDDGEGTVTEVNEFAAVGSSCQASYRCKGGNKCSCLKKASDIQLGAGSFCNGHGGATSDSPVYCDWSPSLNKCKCQVYCADGASVDVDNTGLCDEDERSEKIFVIGKARCPAPGGTDTPSWQGGPSDTKFGELGRGKCQIDPLGVSYYFAQYYNDVQVRSGPMAGGWALYLDVTMRTVPQRCTYVYKFSEELCACTEGPIVRSIYGALGTVLSPFQISLCSNVDPGIPRCSKK